MIKASFEGALQYHPETRTTKTGNPFLVLKFTVGKERPQWVDVLCFDADKVAKFSTFRAGDAFEVTGDLRLSSWTDKTGKKRSSLQVIAESIEQDKAKKPVVSRGPIVNDLNDSIPFAAEFR